MLQANGWFDWAVPFPLPNLDKTILEGGKLISHWPNKMEIVVAHSLEGNVGH